MMYYKHDLFRQMDTITQLDTVKNESVVMF